MIAISFLSHRNRHALRPLVSVLLLQVFLDVCEAVVGKEAARVVPDRVAVSIALGDSRVLVVDLYDCRLCHLRKVVPHDLLASVVQDLRVLLVLVLVNRRQRLLSQHLLRVHVLLQLKDEFVDIVRLASYLTLRLDRRRRELLQLGLQLGDLPIFLPDLVFLDDEQTLHLLVLVFRLDDLVALPFVLVEELAKVLISLLRVLFDLALDQGRLRGVVRDAFFDQLAPRVQRADLTLLRLEKTLVEVDQCLVLHLAVAPVAGPVQSLVLQRKLNLVLRAVFTD